MSDARQPILRYFFARSKPGVSCGTMMLEISARPLASRPVTAVIVVPAVMSVPLLVMNALVPLITHLPSRSSARVCVAPASLPALGSVRPKPHSFSPLASGTRYSSFCFSVPNRRRGDAPSDTCAASVIPVLASARLISITASA